MSSNSLPLVVEGISKSYQMYEQPADRLKQMLIAPLYRKFSPNKKKQFYSEYQALDDVSFQLRKGDTIGIIGENGAGKSTLLQIISGTLSPSAGRVAIEGRVAALLELGSSFDPEFTGIENVYLYGAIFGLDRNEMTKRLDAICNYADIGDYIHQPIKTYSSGMVVRLAFSVIVHVDADILIIDEALTVGDAFFVQKCMRFLRDFRKKGTVLFVSHDMATVVNLCSRVIWLEGGRVKMEGSPKRVSEAYLEAQVMKTQKLSEAEMHRKEVVLVATAGDNCQGVETRDMRLDFLNCTNLRNDMEVFTFTPDSLSFGQRTASIVNITLTDSEGQPLSWMVGGENVHLVVHCQAHGELVNPIVGFYVKDRLGQYLFGDNTYISYVDIPLCVGAKEQFQARFAFRMPLLPVGEYSISPAIAVGTQDEHVTQHWLHDGLVFRSHTSSVINSLVGIPMTTIEMHIGARRVPPHKRTDEDS